MMALKLMMTGVAALALAVTPALAAAQTSAPSELAPTTEPATENLRGSELQGSLRDNLAGVLVIIGFGLVLYLVIDGLFLDDDESPVSP